MENTKPKEIEHLEGIGFKSSLDENNELKFTRGDQTITSKLSESGKCFDYELDGLAIGKKQILELVNPQLTGSEAVFGFAAWLTGRKEAITIGSTHDAAKVAELCGEFCEVNNLPDPRKNWFHYLHHPKSK